MTQSNFSFSFFYFIFLLFTKFHELKLEEVAISIVFFQGMANHMKISSNIPLQGNKDIAIIIQ